MAGDWKTVLKECETTKCTDRDLFKTIHRKRRQTFSAGYSDYIQLFTLQGRTTGVGKLQDKHI